MIYVREAHPHEGKTEAVRNTVTFAQRRQNALAFARSMSLTMPMLVDGMDNRAYNDFYVYQAAFYVLDKQGRTAYRSGLAAYALDPNDVEKILTELTAPPSPNPRATQRTTMARQDSAPPTAN